MKEGKVWLILRVLIGVFIIYLVSQNIKYSQNLLTLFKAETSSLMEDSYSIEYIGKIADNADVTNDFKNTVLSNEQNRLCNIMNWLFNLNVYTIADENIKTLSIDVSKEVIIEMDTINSLKEKDISEFNESDRKTLNEYKVFLETLSENTMAINSIVREDVIIPIYTRSHIEKYIYNIGNGLLHYLKS